MTGVAPARERGLKFIPSKFCTPTFGRSREGAWIEILPPLPSFAMPSRRSREGAWIEISTHISEFFTPTGRSREGAWIEIILSFASLLTRFGRSREGAWIEMSVAADDCMDKGVAPARERGLK